MLLVDEPYGMSDVPAGNSVHRACWVTPSRVHVGEMCAAT